MVIRIIRSSCHWIYFVSIFRTNGFQEKDGKNNGDELHAFEDLVQDQIDSFDKHNYGYINDQVIKHRDLIRMLLMKQDAFLTENNKIDLFTDGHKLYEKYLRIFTMLKTIYI